MITYKIRNVKTGLYSTGGVCPSWSTRGKSWSTMGHVRNHLNHIKAPRTSRLYEAEDWEIVQFQANEVTAWSVVVELKAIHDKKERDRAAQYDRRIEAQRRNDVAELERLKNKLGM